MRSIWGTVVIFALIVGGGASARARAESDPALVLSPTERQALVDARQLTGAGIGLSVLGSASGAAGAGLAIAWVFTKDGTGNSVAALSLTLAGPVLVGVGIGLVSAGKKLEREVRSDRKVAVGPGGFAVRF